jgi:hypothetical protein
MLAQTSALLNRGILRCLIGLFLAWSTVVAAQSDSSEAKLESAYLVNFAKYVEWPANNRSTTTICLFGRDTLGTYLSAHEGRQAGGRELRIRRIYNADDITTCQMVYIPDVEEARLGAVLRWIANAPILTVSNMEGFAQLGGGIELVRSNGRVQFIVNTSALSRNGLTASTPMLRLALRVIGTDR